VQDDAAPFTRRFFVRWGDLDFNGHMRNTAYLDTSADVRMLYFQAHGFSIAEFTRLRFGPVIVRDELEYMKELRMLDAFDVTLRLVGLSADGARFRLRNEFFAEDGAPVARVTSTGGWLDLSARRLTAPPAELSGLLASLVRSGDYEPLRSSRAKGEI
jgi:acyl-CoA thioester hydrolase